VLLAKLESVSNNDAPRDFRGRNRLEVYTPHQSKPSNSIMKIKLDATYDRKGKFIC
jgi:hypothetical protein